MTEAEWLASEEPSDAMCSAAINSPGWSFRKETLFCLACGRRVLAILPNDQVESLLNDFESRALGVNTSEPISPGRALSEYALKELYSPDTVADQGLLFTVIAITRGYISQVAETAIDAMGRANYTGVVADLEERRQAAWLRDIVGNPFRPVAFDPAWRTSTAVALAQGMYESRDFGAMLILADALQDAGCDSGEVLDHCRGPGPHVRGCWVVDLVLGKA